MMSIGKRERAARLLEGTGAGTMLRALRAWRGLLVMNYHRIGDPTDSPFDRDVFSATPELLDRQLAFARQHFDVISPYDLPDVIERRGGRYLLLTFDDGYRDNYEHAFPILQAHSLRAVFFLTTGFLDRAQLAWWDEIAWMIRRSPRESLTLSDWMTERLTFDEPSRERAVRAALRLYKSLRGELTGPFLNALGEATESGRCGDDVAGDTWMTWDMARELKAAGMWIGGHTVTHPVLSSLSRAEQANEIESCKRRLWEELGDPMRLFSYPVGSRHAFNDDTRACLNDAGVELAFSFYGGYRRFNDWDPYDIPRAIVTTSTTLPIFRATATLPQVFARW